MSALAEIISSRMHDNGAAQYAVLANQLDQRILYRPLCVSLAIGLEVAEVADVALAVLRGPVGLAVRVDWTVQCRARMKSKGHIQ